ncbi:MAG: metallophosphoesterase, partial [Myxococcota bacterium]
MRRAASKGGLFPGRPSPREAPGGSTEHPRRGNILWRLIDEHRWLTTSEHRVPLSSLQQTITVLHLSDIHLRGQDRDLDALCEAIGGFTVDLVVITGDTVTFGWTEGAVHQLLQSLPDAPLGKFAIMGNWEYWARA